jgi:Tfp pilus assembly protein PilF
MSVWSAQVVVCAVIAACVLCVAACATRNGFVTLDDSLYVATKPASEGLTPASVAFAFTTVETLYWHPLAWLSHELDIEEFGFNAGGHHFTSALLHALAAGLLCLVFFRLGAKALSAAMGSLLWALHPLRVESFAWVAERKDVLCALFFVAAIAAYLRYIERPSRVRYAGWLCCGALALMSKPAAVSLPAVLLLLDYWPRKRGTAFWRLVAEKLPLAAMAGCVMFLTVLGQVRSGSTSYLADVPIGPRLACAAVSYVRYLGKIVWPVNLACFYPYQRNWPGVWVAASVMVLAAITALAIVQRKRRPWLLVGWCWFVVAVLPNAGLIQAGRQAMADRFTHLGTIGLTIAAVCTVVDWAGSEPRRNRFLAYGGGAVLLAWAALTIRQIGFWHDSETLFTHAIAVEDSEYMRGNLAEMLAAQGRDGEAERQFLAAIHLDPGRFEHHTNLANLLLKTGRVEEAAHEAEIGLRLKPDHRAVVYTAGQALLRNEDYAGALAQFTRAVELGADPRPISIRLNDAGASLATRGRLADAEPLVREAIRLNPTLVQARRNLVLVLVDSRRPGEARAALEEAVKATGPLPEYRDLEPELGSREAGSMGAAH